MVKRRTIENEISELFLRKFSDSPIPIYSPSSSEIFLEYELEVKEDGSISLSGRRKSDPNNTIFDVRKNSVLQDTPVHMIRDRHMQCESFLLRYQKNKLYQDHQTSEVSLIREGFDTLTERFEKELGFPLIPVIDIEEFRKFPEKMPSLRISSYYPKFDGNKPPLYQRLIQEEIHRRMKRNKFLSK